MRGNLLKWLRKILILSIAPLGIYGTLELSRYFGTDAQYLPDAAFFTVFEEIKVDQFAWNPRMGRGGIYWVSENEIVTMADINKERGIYLINVLNGSSKKLVDTGRSDSKLHGYCFSQGVLFVSAQLKSEPFKIEYRPSNFEVVSNRTEELGDRIRSGVRCGFYQRPVGLKQGSILGLLEADGLIQTLPDDSGSIAIARVVEESGNSHIILTTDTNIASEIRISPRFYEFLDGYFSYRQVFKSCSGVSAWTLRRHNWKLEVVHHCLGKWASERSLSIVPTKYGLFTEQHGSSKKRPWAMYHLVTSSGQYPIDMIGGKGASTSPDGCKVIYGSGEFKMSWRNEYEQYLKIFDVCAYIEAQELELNDV